MAYNPLFQNQQPGNPAAYALMAGWGGQSPMANPTGLPNTETLMGGPGGYRPPAIVPGMAGPQAPIAVPGAMSQGSMFGSSIMNSNAAMNTPVTAPPAGNWWDGFVGTREQPGWGGLALGGAAALTSGYLGFQQLGLAKDTLAQNKKEFELNFDAQKRTTNAQLEDRQRARLSGAPGAYESITDYMSKNAIR